MTKNFLENIETRPEREKQIAFVLLFPMYRYIVEETAIKIVSGEFYRDYTKKIWSN